MLPSNRPEGLELYLESLRSNADNWNEIEVVVLVDDVRNYLEIHGNVQIYHYKRSEPLNVSELQNECYRLSTGRWIMLSNDDVVMKTKHWDSLIKKATNIYHDEVALIFPEDGMFGKNLSCFPIISRRVIEAIKFFPQPYRRYKVDDTIFQIFPSHRKIFLGNVLQTHLNDKGKVGFSLPDGRIYPIDREAADFDGALWPKEAHRRMEMADTIQSLTGEMKLAKIMVAIPTMDIVRSSKFYEHYNMLDKPEGTICSFTRGQSPAKARNMLAKLAIEHHCTHIMFIDDDMTFSSDLLTRLFSHNKDVVTALYFKRQYPHEPLIFHNRQPDGSCQFLYPAEGEKGLIEIENCGFGAVLIKTEVFKKMKEPWVTLGEYLKDEWCDDISFFNRVRDLGYKIHCDLDTMCGHMTTVEVKPQIMNGQLIITYNTDGQGNVGFQLPRPEVKEDGVSEVTA